MSTLKKGQSVKARTTRGTEVVKGTITAIENAKNGQWITVKPEDKDATPFRTRPACVELA